MRNEIKLWLKVIVIAILVQPLYSLASNIGTLTSFTAGTPIQSAQVNGNFTAITTAVNSKQDAVNFTCPGGEALTGYASGTGPTCAAVGGLAFGDSVTGSAANSGLVVTNSGAGAGLEGDNSSTNANAYGVLGQITATTPGVNSAGVKGQADDTTPGINASGVWGDTKGAGPGVYGTSEGGGSGVDGYAQTGTGVYGSGAVGVVGFSPNGNPTTGAGVIAENSVQGGVALSIQGGYFQVFGAGSNTDTTAFLWTASAASIVGDHTVVNNPMTNGNGTLLLIVTQNWTPNSVYNPHPVGIYYNGTNWAIFNEDQATMPANASFNVLVISP